MREIDLKQGKKANVDDAVYDDVNNHKWFAHFDGNNWYALRKHNNKHISMHRQIMGFPNNKFIVDHRDRNGLNNQSDNLRLCTKAENNRNTKSRKGSKSKYLGVAPVSKSKSWRATIGQNKKFIHIGCFKTEEQAALAYNKKAIELHGEFANLNVI